MLPLALNRAGWAEDGTPWEFYYYCCCWTLARMADIMFAEAGCWALEFATFSWFYCCIPEVLICSDPLFIDRADTPPGVTAVWRFDYCYYEEFPAAVLIMLKAPWWSFLVLISLLVALAQPILSPTDYYKPGEIPGIGTPFVAMLEISVPNILLIEEVLFAGLALASTIVALCYWGM